MRKQKKAIIIGLTGPIASGKNTAAGFFRSRYVIDVDRIGHEILSSQSMPWHKVVKTFGIKVLKRGGKVNRRKLGEIVFSNPGALRMINKITHPEILKRVRKKIKDGLKSKRRFVIVNAAVLKEIGLIPYVDHVISVLSPKGKRLKRLVSKKVKKIAALHRISSQRSDKEYRKISDFVVINNSTKGRLQKSIEEIVSKLG
ncbi:dephospho-CoA kinase [Candidatus Margulisiibacteriota bacterium]